MQLTFSKLLQKHAVSGVNLAKILGVTQASASRLRNGKQRLTPAHAAKISRFFKLKIGINARGQWVFGEK